MIAWSIVEYASFATLGYLYLKYVFSYKKDADFLKQIIYYGIHQRLVFSRRRYEFICAFLDDPEKYQLIDNLNKKSWDYSRFLRNFHNRDKVYENLREAYRESTKLFFVRSAVFLTPSLILLFYSHQAFFVFILGYFSLPIYLLVKRHYKFIAEKGESFLVYLLAGLIYDSEE